MNIRISAHRFVRAIIYTPRSPTFPFIIVISPHISIHQHQRVRMRSRLGTSFTPSPAKLSPPQLDVSCPPPALLYHDAQRPETRRSGPLVELVLDSPVLNKSRKLRSGVTCYVVAAEPDTSAVSDTEGTPLADSSAPRRHRTAIPQRRAVPGPDLSAQSETSSVPIEQAVPPPPQRKARRPAWDATVHVCQHPASLAPYA